MNRVVNAGSQLLWNVGSFLTSTARTAVRYLSLTPPYISHLLWLLSQKFLDLAREGYGSNAAVYAVMRVLCTSVAEPPCVPYRRQEDGTPDLTAPLPYQHPLVRLLRRPNPWLTEYEHLELVTLHLGITGRYTAWKERNNDGSIRAIWPLRPDRVGPIYGDQSQGEPLLVGWSYLVPGTMIYLALRAEDVIMMNFADPLGESGGLVEGQGPLQALAIEVGADLEASRFVGNMVANYGQPGVVLQIQGQLKDKEDAQLIKQAFMQDFGGVRRGQPAVIDKGSTISTLGFSLQQLEFPALRRVSESRIAGAFGVPAILAGLLVGLEASSTNATVDEIRAFFAETTLSGYWKRYADAFTNQLAVEFGEDLVCAFDLTKVAALAGRAASRIAEIRDAFERGVVLVAEYREALGLPDDGKGDVYLYGIAPGRGAQTVVDPAMVSAANVAANAAATTVQAGQALPDGSAPGQSGAGTAPGNATAPGSKATVIDPQMRRVITESVATALNRGQPDAASGRAAIASAFDEVMASLEPTPENAMSNGSL